MAVSESTTKFCNKCNAITDRYKSGKCKPCEKISHAAYVERNKEKIARYKAEWRLPKLEQLRFDARERYHSNRERHIENVSKWAAENKQKIKKYKKKWKRLNPLQSREYVFLRVASRRMATPKWCSKSAMLAIYREARAITKNTGIEHHVDHIIPLRSDLVCGLHCEQNMQILTAFENQSKLNRSWPDMP